MWKGLALAAALLAAPAIAAPAPHVTIASFTQLKTPLPYPYDEHADADAAVKDGEGVLGWIKKEL